MLHGRNPEPREQGSVLVKPRGRQKQALGDEVEHNNPEIGENKGPKEPKIVLSSLSLKGLRQRKIPGT